MGDRAELDAWKKRLDSMHMLDKIPCKVYEGEVYHWQPIRSMNEDKTGMAIKTNEHIQTKGIEIIPQMRSGKTVWMFRFTRIDGSSQSSDGYSGPFEALTEALHTLREEGENPAWQEHLKKKIAEARVSQ